MIKLETNVSRQPRRKLDGNMDYPISSSMHSHNLITLTCCPRSISRLRDITDEVRDAPVTPPAPTAVSEFIRCQRSNVRAVPGACPR